MRINTKVRYAVRMMVEMAKYGDGAPVALHDIAGRSSLSKMYLSQLAAPLKNAGLIKSYWGNRGGYVLNRPASQISLLEIIEAVDGPIALLDCVADPEMCKRSRSCEAIGVWRAINETIVTNLRSYSLADLIRRPKPPTHKEEAEHRLSKGGRDG
jgi:Rrf2 family protein